jgi:hypothetical protein
MAPVTTSSDMGSTSSDDNGMPSSGAM